MSTTLPTPYPALNQMLHELIERVQEVLTTNFIGAYLQGSFAVGDFDLHSDVDFIMVTADELSEEEVSRLQGVHEQVYGLDIPWAQHLEGSYFPKEVLRDYTQRGRPLWYLDHGSRSLIRSSHCNTILVRRVVRDYGVALSGPVPTLLVDPIPVEALRREMMVTLQDWGQEILNHPEPYNNRFYQGFIVLNYCRMLHDLQRGVPGSKLAGARWAKANLDPYWHRLIDRAWAGRPDPAVSSRQVADMQDFQRTLQFVQYCKQIAYTLYPEFT